MPLYRIVATPITDGALVELADRLGMAADRRYSFTQSSGLDSWVDDGEWNLMFFRSDLDCFSLRASEGDEEAMGAFERGEEVQAVSAEEAIAIAVEIGGLRLIDAGVTVDVAPGGRVVGFSHKVQRAEPDEVKVPILSVEKAVEDVQAGQGLLPNEARMDNVSQLTIEGVELAYYDPPEALNETHYRPVYVFHVRMADGSEGAWIVSAYEGLRR
jgi:hypothetical protein